VHLTNLSFVLFVCQKLSNSVEIWRRSGETVLHGFCDTV